MTQTPTPVTDRNRIQILDVPIDVLTMVQCIERIGQYIEEGCPHLIVTADACGIVQAQSDSALMKLYNDAQLVTADSAGVMWAAKRKGQRLPERVSGVDIVDQVCAKSAELGWRIFFLGAAPGVAELAAEKQRLKHPGCNIVGVRDGYFPADSDSIIAEEIAKSKPNVLFVGMGIPRQEKFILGTQHIIGAQAALGVGGSFDVFSGKVQRAPRVFQSLKLEWLWRLIQDRSKISKVKLLPEFVARILRSPKV